MTKANSYLIAVKLRVIERRAIMATITGTSSVYLFNFQISGESLRRLWTSSDNNKVMEDAAKLVRIAVSVATSCYTVLCVNIFSDSLTSLAAIGDSEATIKWKPKP
jgi:hypothetical protein